MRLIFVLFLSLTLSVTLQANSSETYSSIVSEIQKKVQCYDATVGVAVIINGKDTITVNNDIRYPMMSVFKFHQALAVCDYLQKNHISCDSVIHVSKYELKQNTYSPLRDENPDGNIDIALSKLLSYTLVFSDNNACDILFDRILNVKNTDSYIRSLGINDFAIEMTEDYMHINLDNCYKNWSTPLSAAVLLEKFISGYTITGEYRSFIENTMMECSTGRSRLLKPLENKNLRIGHKTGTGDKNRKGEFIGINDIGFVYLPDGGRYVISVFVKDSSESYDTTENIIAEISSIVYNSIIKYNKINIHTVY